MEILSGNGVKRTIRTRIEVVLAAGALQTPQILELSGIGDREILTKQGVPVIIENENVGCNLQDHPIVCESFEVADGVMSGDILRDPDLLKAIVAQYQSSQDGPLGQSIISSAYVPSMLSYFDYKLKDSVLTIYCVVADSSGILTMEARSKFFEANIKTTANFTSSQLECSELDRQVIRDVLETTNEPTYQLMLFPTQLTIPESPRNVSDYITPSEPENYVTVMVFLNHPLSRGTCHITSPSVEDKPTWDPPAGTTPRISTWISLQMVFNSWRS